MKKISDFVTKQAKPVKHLQVRMTPEVFEAFCAALERKDLTAQSVLHAGIMMFISEVAGETKKIPR